MTETPSSNSAEAVAPDCRDINGWEADPGLQALLPSYLSPDLFAHLSPHFHRLGELVGGRLGELAETADKHPPVLHARDRRGRSEDWIEYHPAYREMENIAFTEFGLHALSHRGDVLGWPEPLPAVRRRLRRRLQRRYHGLSHPSRELDLGQERMPFR